MKTGSKDVTQGRHGLHYIGDGSGVPGVPARDLAESEIVELAGSQGQDVRDFVAALLTSALYEPGTVAAPEPVEEG